MRRFLLVSLNNDPTVPLGSKHAGGQTKYVLELTKNLLFQGHEVEVLTIGHRGQPMREEFAPGAVVTRFFRNDGESYDYDISQSELCDIADRIIAHVTAREQPVDLILCCYWVSGDASVRLKAELGCPMAVTFCQLASFKRKGEVAPELAGRFQSEQDLGHAADAVIATNAAERTTLAQDYGIAPEKIHLIPRGIDLTVFHP
ncbi:Mannosylfructose-phosphate synthase (plasmid) [Phaeobacter inhibens]|uniref:Mannosylfructose-phosphate synthase n=1 Tax=Phaeobacter inhibens TaxID=221822 RepID=A0ABM6RKC5_9RHOB|nr:glycosyltransferase [Phaeobacter inhibens]AUQ52409.1 Mannosylfructose-phosphate synthase [Phaeobacter inhibens]AUQ97014.1 Mannosylfructose-phosphate synthase [Phaeobacter inhibens]AUR22214.1 Mannosylfructose-phosphate synthase [Phaeobacter inhibens]